MFWSESPWKIIDVLCLEWMAPADQISKIEHRTSVGKIDHG